MNVRAVVWREGGRGGGRRFDGALTRRSALLCLLERHVTLECLELASTGTLLGAMGNLVRLVRFLRSPSTVDRLVLFYPDFPLFHPPRTSKLPVLSLVLSEVRRLHRRRGVSLHLDIVDLPRWQAIDLGYRLRMPESRLKAAEKRLLDEAHLVTIPSSSLASLLIEDLSLSPERLVVLPNGLPETARPKEVVPVEGTPSVVYVGDLSRTLGRGVPRLIDDFLRAASPKARLHLCGEGGEWIGAQTTDARVRHWGHLDEERCIALAAGCDFGLIPYPERNYFRWCFPSKLGLYLTAGTAILSSRLDETTRVIEELGVGEARPLDEFATFFSDGVALKRRYKRSDIRERCLAYRWDDVARAALRLEARR